jgi:hypothetical protein
LTTPVPAASIGDALVSVPKAALTQWIGSLPASRLPDLDRALLAALEILPGSTSP